MSKELLKRLFKPLLPILVKWFGSNIQDARTGKWLGKAVLLPWGNTFRVVGLGHAFLALRFAPSTRTLYWHQNIEFFTHPPVDYPRIAPQTPPVSPSRARILWVILAHQNAETVRQILAHWSDIVPVDDILVLYGGKSRAEFDLITHPQKLFITDSRLHTTAHILQKQSYTQALKDTASWMRLREEYSHIYFAESDLFPIREDVAKLLLDRASDTHADVLFYHLTRVDGTNWCHLLYHQSSPNFSTFFPSISIREEKETILNAIGCGSLWVRECFEALTAVHESEPVFLELFLPTVAHHLGYRVAEISDQNQFIDVLPKTAKDVTAARKQNAWFVHPVKDPKELAALR